MQRIIRETSGKTMGDADGWKRGERGFGKDAKSSKFATPDFNRERNQGPVNDGGAVSARVPSGGKLPQGKGYKGVD